MRDNSLSIFGDEELGVTPAPSPKPKQKTIVAFTNRTQGRPGGIERLKAWEKELIEKQMEHFLYYLRNVFFVWDKGNWTELYNHEEVEERIGLIIEDEQLNMFKDALASYYIRELVKHNPENKAKVLDAIMNNKVVIRTK